MFTIQPNGMYWSSETGVAAVAIKGNVNELASRAPKCNFVATTNPSTSQNNSGGYYKGSRWINTTGPTYWICVAADGASATWLNLSTGGGGGIPILSSGDRILFDGADDPNWGMGLGSDDFTVDTVNTANSIKISFGDASTDGLAFGVKGGESLLEMNGNTGTIYARNRLMIGTTSDNSEALQMGDGKRISFPGTDGYSYIQQDTIDESFVGLSLVCSVGYPAKWVNGVLDLSGPGGGTVQMNGGPIIFESTGGTIQTDTDRGLNLQDGWGGPILNINSDNYGANFNGMAAYGIGNATISTIIFAGDSSTQTTAWIGFPQSIPLNTDVFRGPGNLPVIQLDANGNLFIQAYNSQAVTSGSYGFDTNGNPIIIGQVSGPSNITFADTSTQTTAWLGSDPNALPSNGSVPMTGTLTLAVDSGVAFDGSSTIKADGSGAVTVTAASVDFSGVTTITGIPIIFPLTPVASSTVIQNSASQAILSLDDGANSNGNISIQAYDVSGTAAGNINFDTSSGEILLGSAENAAPVKILNAGGMDLQSTDIVGVGTINTGIVTTSNIGGSSTAVVFTTPLAFPTGAQISDDGTGGISFSSGTSGMIFNATAGVGLTLEGNNFHAGTIFASTLQVTGALADGTYTPVTSITITNGVISAIS